jgi:transposase-like protein
MMQKEKQNVIMLTESGNEARKEIGQTMTRFYTLAELARTHGLPKDTLYKRYRKGLRGAKLIQQ